MTLIVMGSEMRQNPCGWSHLTVASSYGERERVYGGAACR